MSGSKLPRTPKSPTILDVTQAAARIRPYIIRTVLQHYPVLDKLIGAEVYVKHENHQRLGSFKIRGALNVLLRISEKENCRTVITASTGNQGKAIAYAANQFGLNASVVLPEAVGVPKAEAIRSLGASVILKGRNFEESREHAEQLAKKEGYRYIDPVNDPALMAGFGTYTLEILEELPTVDFILVPVGGGSAASSACIVAKSANSSIQVVGVQPEKAPAAYLSWKQGKLVQARAETKADALATGEGYELPQLILRRMLDDFVLVSENELDEAVVLHLKNTHNLVEHAGAASLAAALKMKKRLKGKRAVLVASGNNLSLDILSATLRRVHS